MEVLDDRFRRGFEVDLPVAGGEDEVVGLGEEVARDHFVQVSEIGHQLINNITQNIDHSLA